MHVLDLVRRTIRRYELASSTTRVVAALSGGSDSVALVSLLQSLHEAGDLLLVAVCHFNHQLRPSAADDERFCRSLTERIGVPIVVEAEDVGARARAEHRSIEDAARTARHAFFERARLNFSGDVVALGHSRDDQAETFLLRLLRGSGPRGLAAMHPKRQTLVRPLIECRRSDLRAYLQACGLSFVEDETNADVRIPRNRVRAELMPLLARRFNPSIVDVLADEADIARADWAWMESEAARLAPSILSRQGRQWQAEAAALSAMPLALARVVVRRALTATSGGRPVAFAHVEAVLRLAREGGTAVDLPGHRLERFGSDVVLTSREPGAKGRPRAPQANLFSFPLSIPGETTGPGWVISAERAPVGDRDRATESRDGTSTVVQLGPGDGPLAVRSRRPGDRFRPLGLAGCKKLQDFFVDRKVPRDRRDRVPIVVDQEDRIVWVAGYAVAHEFRVTEASEGVVILRLKVLGGSR